LPGQHLVIPTDIADPQAVAGLVEQTIAAFGRIDLVISNAGVGLAAPVMQIERADFLRALDVNLFGPLALTQAVVPHMRQQRHGQLLFVSSVVGLRALPYLGGYAAAKAALDRLTEALRVELRGSGVVVTLMRPGTTDTGFNQRRLGRGHEIRRAGRRGVPPEHVAQALLRAARREPRVAYVTLADRLTVWAGLLAPGLTDRTLASAFGWQDPDDSVV
jgi:short-subunit dehydrogenase